MTQEIKPEEANFLNGEPTVEYDHIYRCFQGEHNGLLFRLVTEKNHQWAFYNDTTDLIIKIRARFGPGSNIKALRRARLVTIPSEDGTVDDTCEQEVTVEVEPHRTELFIEGQPNGFSLDFETDVAPVANVKFEYRRPTTKYDKVYKCFKNNGNGLLFRLVDEHSKTWSFYNDTREFTMKIKVTFTKREEVKALGKTVDAGAPEDNEGGVVLTLEVAPGKTEQFAEVNGGSFQLRFLAEPLGNDKPLSPDEIHYENDGPDFSLVDASSKVYKCFKDHGNGLLFRLVDEKKKMWAFYNDTRDFIMTATVAFPINETYEVCPSATVTEDPERPDVKVVVMDIPPASTLSFIEGLPESFEVSFSAKNVSNAEPEENPQYENGSPDESVVAFTEVYKCFKNRGNGLLFRLVDTSSKRWGFYNDTKDFVFTARLQFDAGAKVKALGTTVVDKDPEMGITYVIEVDPLQTVPFVEVDTPSFVSKFEAKRKAA